MLSIQLLLILMIAAALAAVEAKGLFASVIALGLMGLELSLVFLLLKAPDIAVMLLVIEMIAFAFLINTVMKHKPEAFKDFNLFSSLTFTAFAALFVIICVKAFADMPLFGSPDMKLAAMCEGAMEKTGAANMVAAVAFNFRGLDSLIAVLAFFLTAVGIIHITGKKE